MGIVGRFHEALRSIHDQFPNAHVHIVAHSEGTVVSLLGMLEAMSGNSVFPADPTKHQPATKQASGTVPGWLKQVKGFITIGSPIDKHLLLWPRLWNDFHSSVAEEIPAKTAEEIPAKVAEQIPAKQIHWRNYYDYGDPVGFQLDTAKEWLRETGITMFDFPDENDIGFSRYLLPGEADNEYWNDPAVFEDFIVNVVKDQPSENTRPKTKPLIAVLSPTLPYLLSFIVLLCGVFILNKALNAYTHPSLDPLQRFVRFRELGVKPQAELAGWPLFSGVFGLGALLFGVTLIGRIPRLAGGLIWNFVGLGAFIVGAILYWLCVPGALRGEIGGHFSDVFPLVRHMPTIGVVGVALLSGLTGYLVTPPRMRNRKDKSAIINEGIKSRLGVRLNDIVPVAMKRVAF